MQVPMSWVEQFMNWYPRNTRLYRRKSKADPPHVLQRMSVEFEELKPFFVGMANTIWAKALAKEREETLQLCQAVLQCQTIGEAKAMAQQAVERMAKGDRET